MKFQIHKLSDDRPASILHEGPEFGNLYSMRFPEPGSVLEFSHRDAARIWLAVHPHLVDEGYEVVEVPSEWSQRRCSFCDRKY